MNCYYERFIYSLAQTFLVLILAFCAQGQSHDATLEIAAPAISVSSYNINATLPVPHGMVTTSMIDSGMSPFSIKNADGTLAATQIEGISRAADGSWDVVQLLAKVKSQGNAQGSRDQYKVVRTPSVGSVRPVSFQTLSQVIANGPVAQLPTSIQTLTQGTGKILIRTFDVFGNEYRFDFGSKAGKIFKFGPSQSEVRVYGTMTPGTPGVNNALPHMMGAHGYFSALAGEEVLQLWLRVSNASTGLNLQTAEDDTQADLYFSKIELMVPVGYEVRNAYADLGWGTSYTQGGYNIFPIVKDLGGAMNVMPTQRHFIRHLAIIPSTPTAQVRVNSILAQEGIAFAVKGISTTSNQPLFSFFSANYRGFLPQSGYVPDLSFANLTTLRSTLTSDFQSYSSKYSAGQCTSASGSCDIPFVNPYMGWAMIDGAPYGGMTSGTNIQPLEGMQTVAAASAEGYRLHILQFMTNAIRQQLFVKDSGDAVNVEDIKKTGSCGTYAPIEFAETINVSTYDPFGLKTTNKTHVNYIASNNLAPWYAPQMSWTGSTNYDPHDFQHNIRTQKNDNALAWIGGLPIAMDQIQTNAGNASFQHSKYPVKCSGNNPVHLASSVVNFPPAVPNITIKFGRGEAWWEFALLAAYATSKDDNFRASLKPFFDIPVRALEQAVVPCTGLFHGVVNKDTNNLFVAAQNYQKAFAELVMNGVAARVYQYTGAPEEALLNSFLKAASKTPLRRGYALKTNGGNSMRRLMIVADKNTPTQTFCNISELPTTAKAFLTKPDSGERYLAFAQYAEVNPAKADLYAKVAFLTMSGLSSALDLLSRLQVYKTQHGKLIDQVTGQTGQLLACIQNGLCPNY